jgi:hypothetical protein
MLNKGMKKCSTCKLVKLIDAFAINKTKKDGRSYYCKDCQKQKSKKHYAANKLDYTLRNKRRKKLVMRKKCILCPESSVCCLDFHHRNPSEKKGNMSFLAQTHSWKMVLKEIEKCVILCANCHRKIHAGEISL